MKNIFLVWLNLALVIKHPIDITCRIFEPLDGKADGQEIGVIFIPGAKIECKAYGPLAKRIQLEFPGKLWVALTEDWWFNFPNPIQIGPDINACFAFARYDEFYCVIDNYNNYISKIGCPNIICLALARLLILLDQKGIPPNLCSLPATVLEGLLF